MNLIWLNDKTGGGGAAKLFFTARDVLERHGHTVAPFFGHYARERVPLEWLPFQPPLVRERAPVAIARLSFPNKRVTAKLEDLIAKVQPDAAVVQNVHQYLSPDAFNVLHAHGVPIVFLVNDYAFSCVNCYDFRHGAPCHRCEDKHFYRGALLKCALKPGVVGYLESIVRSAALHYFWRRGAFLLADAAYTSGEALTGQLARMGFPRERIVSGVFPLGLDVQPAPGHVGDYFVFYGSELAPKGQDILLDALDYLEQPTELHFYLLRASSALAERIERINARGKHHIVLDVRMRWDTGVKEMVQRARAVVIPSSWDCPHELVLYESLALGKAVIVSSGTGNAEVIADGENGVIFDMAGPEALAGRMRALSRDTQLAQRLGEAGRETYEDKLVPEQWYAPFMRAVELARGGVR